jgi:adenosylmethionine-8-amino-7-oxononanoate aminotransferase
MLDTIANSWEERDQRNVFHGFTDLQTLNSNGPVVLTHGEGIFVHDVNGNTYMDANSGLWNSVAGFNHPGLTEAMVAQTRKFPGYHAFFGRISDSTVALSERLISVSPFESGKVFYTNSGSEANDTSVKMLWMLNRRKGNPQRRKIITRKNAYHGVTVVTASMTGKDYNEEFGLPLPGFLHADCPHYWRFGLDGESEAEFTTRMARNLEELIIKEGADTIAGFFAEPVMGAGGVIPPPAGYFEAIRQILRKYDIPLVADEVICGFGRTGEMWGSTKYNMEPDIIIASKCITAGFFPMGAIILSQEFADELKAVSEEAGEFPHGFTTGGHPVGSAVALKAIDVIENEGLLENVQKVGPYFQQRLRELGEHKYCGEARGVGLMGALELVADQETKEAFPGELALSERIANKALANGLICRPLGAAVVLGPPFIITERQIDDLFSNLEKTMSEVFADVGL